MMGQLMTTHIRKAEIGDARDISEVHINSWRETYSTIIDNDFLASLDIEQRTARWIDILQKRPESVFVTEANAEIVGFAGAGKSRTMNNYDGELYALYLLKKYQGLSLGKQLFFASARYLQSIGCDSMYVAVLRDNPTVHFYKKYGGKYIMSEEIKIGGKYYTEELYGWDTIRSIILD